MFLTGAALHAPTAGHAQSTEDAGNQLQQVQDDMKTAQAHREELERQAQEAAAQVASLRKATLTLAASIREQETGLAAIEGKIADLQAKEGAAQTALQDRLSHMSSSLAALQRLAHRPPIAMIASPQPPDETVESALALRAVVPALQAQARGLSGQIAALAGLRDDIAGERQMRQTELAALGNDKLKADDLLSRRAAAERSLNIEARKEAERVQTLASRAQDLQSLLDTLQREKEKAAALPAPVINDGRPFSAAKGMVPLPVVGAVVQRYGEGDTGGLRSRGIVLEAREHAQVTAPYDGKIVFAGPFRGYGLLLIIDHGEGYHSLLSGMLRIDGVVGQDVLAGEPVGEMGEGGARGSGNDKPQLYVELRHDGNPIDPMPWLAMSDRKVNG